MNPEHTRPWFRQALLAAAIYAVFLFFASLPHYLSGQGLFFQVIWDPVAIYSFFPADKLAATSFSQGFFPLWDMTRGLGAPLVIPAGGQVDFPLNVMAYLADSRLGWEAFVILRVWLTGVFTFLLGRELRMDFMGCLLAGLCFMLCGYIREFQNMPDISLLTVTPLMLLFMARLARTPRILDFIMIMLLGTQLDVNPESAAYAFAYATFFYVALCCHRISSMEKGRLRQALKQGIVYLALFAIGAPSDFSGILPFIEYYGRAWHFHPDVLGLLHVPPDIGIAFVTPLFDYWIRSAPTISLENMEQLTIVPAYAGGVTFVLALRALWGAKRLPAPGLFFAASALFLAGMVFGIPPFNLANRFPLIRYFQNFRYAQPYLALSVAMLSGMALELLLRYPGMIKQLLVIAAAVAAWVAGHLYIFREQVMSTHLVREGLLAFLVIAFLLTVAVAVAGRMRPALKRQAMAAGIFAGAGIELALYFALAAPVFGAGAFRVEAPPAAEFITQREPSGHFRIYGMDQRILHPNLAGLYGLHDVRDQTPLYVKTYVDVMAAANGWETEDEIRNGFLKEGKFFFELGLAKSPPGLLDLMGVRYLLAYAPPGSSPLFENSGVSSVIAPAPSHVFFGRVAAGTVSREGMLLHAPASLAVRPRRDSASGPVVAAAAVQEGRCRTTDGVFMSMVSVGTQNGLLFARHVDSRRRTGWIESELEGPSGDSIVFSTLPGPRDDTRCDFGLWSVPLSMGAAEELLERHGLVKRYEKELIVYENTDALPPVFSAGQVAQGRSLRRVVASLDKEERPADKAWVESDELAGAGFSEAELYDFKAGQGRLSFRSRSKGRAFAVVSNLYFPGWRAFINGREARVHRTDGFLQGVELPPGENEAAMIYQPASFRIGLWLRITALFAMALFPVLSFVHRPSSPPHG